MKKIPFIFLFLISCISYVSAEEQQCTNIPRFGNYYKDITAWQSYTPDCINFHQRAPRFDGGVFQYDLTEKGSSRVVKVTNSPYIKISFEYQGTPVILFSPNDELVFERINPDNLEGYGGANFENHYPFFTADIPTYQELIQYRNVALNPYTYGTRSNSFPKAISQNEYRNMPLFFARNIINGLTANDKRDSWTSRSWEPDKQREPESEVIIDFGRLVEVDKIEIYIRAEFEHDGYFKGGILEFSSGENIPFTLNKTVEKQTIKFPSRETTFLKITKLIQDDSSKWYALSEVEVWGKDALPFSDKISFEEAFANFEIKDGMHKEIIYLLHLIQDTFPQELDFLAYDLNYDFKTFLYGSLEERKKLFDSLAEKYSAKKGKTLKESIQNYISAKEKERIDFIKKLKKNNLPTKYVYVERNQINPSFFGYTEGVSDARGEVLFAPNSALCLLTINDDGSTTREVLLEDKDSVFRDCDVSYDAKKILFSWKKSIHDDFGLYELDLESKEIRIIIKTPRQAYIEAKYLPNNQIVFHSTRCEQSTDCYFTEVSNLYLINSDSTNLRRIGFDQVSTTFPSVCEDGSIIYTRWDYNDRGPVYTQALFKMKYDGSFQHELYGNKSWYPTAASQVRQIPNMPNKFLAILHGHHTGPHGKIATIDTSLGTQENSGVELLAPKRKEDAVRIDTYGQNHAQYEYPYPLNENLFLVSSDPIGRFIDKISRFPYALYLMNSDGKRAMLVRHNFLNCTQAVPIMERKIPELEPSTLDYNSDKGYCFVRNVYYGEGTKGVEKGDIKKLRIVKLDYMNAPMGYMNTHSLEDGVEVYAHSYTPVALGNGAWDVKEILGEVDIEEDGSVYFEVPARTPIYFQPIDKNGYAVTTMRSWATMQPNEFYSCMGCHGDRDASSPQDASLAVNRKAKKLKPFYDVKGGFSYRKVIQPIFDKHCITCHNDRSVARIQSEDRKQLFSVADFAKNKDENLVALIEKTKNPNIRAFSLLDVPIENKTAKRFFNDSYYNLLKPRIHNGAPNFADFMNPVINWLGAQSTPPLQNPYKRGAATSKLLDMLKSGHGKTALTQEELDKISAWIDLYVPYCGNYYEANAWSEHDMKYYKYYEAKYQKSLQEEMDSIKAYLNK